MSLFSILPYDEKCIWHYAQLRNHLQKSGTPIGSLDMLIAAHALATNSILVSNNLKEFSRIPHLKYENWLNSINKGTP
ncbi:MAG: PIN domain-containing protein [Cardiobacteriaceae bacterium]|nr:PIN domain-containing protein [Cardiobacteriaceae bacterium]